MSSRTYLSELERGLKNPTLDKIEQLSMTMGVHPLTLLVECFLIRDDLTVEEIFARIIQELESLEDMERF